MHVYGHDAKSVYIDRFNGRNECVIFVAIKRTDFCMHVWMFMFRPNSCIFLRKHLDVIPATDTIIGEIFTIVWCRIFVISSANGIDLLIFSWYFFVTLLPLGLLISIGYVILFFLPISFVVCYCIIYLYCSMSIYLHVIVL